MGLDQQLYKFYKNTDNTPIKLTSDEAIDLIYWRKANQIHHWMNVNIAPIENCGYHKITKEQLIELQETCKNVLEHKTLEYSMEHLPVMDGFFYGSENYDEYYYEDIQYTYDKLNEIIPDINFENQEIYYWSWW